MKLPTLFEGIALALVASISGSAVFLTLTTLFSAAGVFRLLIAGLCFAYVLYLLARSSEQTGRITVISVWFVVAATAWIFAPSLLIYILIHLAMIWLVRSLYFYSSVLSSLADLGLTGLAMAVAVWAWSVSSSLFLAFWCFFLVQALFVMIPRQFARPVNTHGSLSISEDGFERAHHAAENALRKFTSSTHSG